MAAPIVLPIHPALLVHRERRTGRFEGGKLASPPRAVNRPPCLAAAPALPSVVYATSRADRPGTLREAPPSTPGARRAAPRLGAPGGCRAARSARLRPLRHGAPPGAHRPREARAALGQDARGPLRPAPRELARSPWSSTATR